MNDMYTKGYNGDVWKMDAYLKRDKSNQVWVDPAASVAGGKGSVSSTFGYDNMDANLKYRGKTDSNMRHTSELAWTLPLQEGDQRIKVEVSTTLNDQTFLPDVNDAKTKFFYKATLPKVTGEAEFDNKLVKAWARGAVCPDLAYGLSATYAMDKSSLTNVECGLIYVLNSAFGKIASKLVFNRKLAESGSTDSYEFGLLPPAQQIGDRNVKLYAKVNHAGGNSDLGVAAETSACKCVDVKAKCDFKGLKTLTSAFSATWNAPGGWRIAASLAEVGGEKGTKFGVRFTQGSSPPPL